MAFQPWNLSQQPMSSSRGVVIASDQTPVSVAGTVNIGTIPGSVVTFQGTNPWLVASSIAGGIFPVSGSVAAVVTNNVTVVSSIAGGIFPVSGSVSAVVTNNVTVVSSIAGGIFPISGSVAAVITNTNVNVSGSVAAIVSGSTNSSIIAKLQDSSIIAINAGSVVALSQGSVITLNQGSSILSVPVGSTLTIWQSPSIVGTYAEDAGHTTADKGLFTLAVRNDTVASTASADLDYTVYAVDSAGRILIKPFAAGESQIEGNASTTNTGSVLLVAAAGAGLRNYITDWNIANTGAATTLVTFTDGSASILGYTIAPTTGGSNMPHLATPMRTAANSPFNFTGATATSILYATVRGYKAP